jgi:hypothetical protein
MDIKVGQTWRTRTNGAATITALGRDFAWCRLESSSAAFRVELDGNGLYYNGTQRYDLIERMPRVYIAGPMSGHADLNFPAFHAAAKLYRDRGCFVINPAEINGGADEQGKVAGMTAEEYQEHWVTCMRKDIAALVSCEEIAILPGWVQSKGASLEFHIAKQLGFTINLLD